MPLIQATDICISFGDRTILDAVNFTLDSSARIALTGDNGSGKSTFLKVLAGLISPDRGVVGGSKDVRIAYLPQSGAVIDAPTVAAEMEKAFGRIHPLVKEKEELEQRLGSIREGDGETDKLLHRRHELEEVIIAGGYYHRAVEMEKVLSGLGFKHGDLDTSPDSFSGGWRMRISLGRILLERPDILLLDEPTNYLDIEARGWLEEYLADYPGGFMLVSHDRYFLDHTVNRIAELFLGNLKIYHGNYSTYEKLRSGELKELSAAYSRQIKEIQKIEEFIQRFRYNASKAAMVQSRIRYLENLERIEIPETLKKIHFTFPKAPDSAKLVLKTENLQKSYGPKPVIRSLDLELSRGDRLVLTGMNGAGKSTLMRILAGKDHDFTGTLNLGTGVLAGYFSQESADELTGDSTVLSEIESVSRHLTDQEIRNLLGAFLFRGDDIYKTLSVLSGGEKARLALIKLLLSPVNLLLLDEPTSHLDMASKEVLLNALGDYTGSLVFVAHDRSFTEALADRVLDLGGPVPAYYYGDYEYYLYRKQTGDISPSESAALPKQAAGGGREDRLREKDRKRSRRQLQRREDEIMEEIASLEEEYRRLEEDLSRPEIYTSGDKVRELKGLMQENSRMRESLSCQWEEIDRQISSILDEDEGDG